jgi:hypothetical protein
MRYSGMSTVMSDVRLGQDSTTTAAPCRHRTGHAQTQATLAAWLRSLADWLGLFRMCGRASCRRANGCRGDARACLRACAPGVPEPVRDFVRAMLEAQDEGLSFEAALDDADEHREAYECWMAGLHA